MVVGDGGVLGSPFGELVRFETRRLCWLSFEIAEKSANLTFLEVEMRAFGHLLNVHGRYLVSLISLYNRTRVASERWALLN